MQKLLATAAAAILLAAPLAQPVQATQSGSTHGIQLAPDNYASYQVNQISDLEREVLFFAEDGSSLGSWVEETIIFQESLARQWSGWIWNSFPIPTAVTSNMGNQAAAHAHIEWRHNSSLGQTHVREASAGFSANHFDSSTGGPWTASSGGATANPVNGNSTPWVQFRHTNGTVHGRTWTITPQGGNNHTARN